MSMNMNMNMKYIKRFFAIIVLSSMTITASAKPVLTAGQRPVQTQHAPIYLLTDDYWDKREEQRQYWNKKHWDQQYWNKHDQNQQWNQQQWDRQNYDKQNDNRQYYDKQYYDRQR